MAASPLPLHHLISARELRARTTDAPPRWCLADLSGRLIELSGNGADASLTLAFRLVLDAQLQGETVAWISPLPCAFYPPDAAEGGIDLDAIAVIQVPDGRRATRAADHLLRSGALGLVVLDLGRLVVPTAAQTRLLGLAQKHGAALLCLTAKAPDRPSLGSLVSLRGEARRVKVAPDAYRCELHALKDKRRPPGWTWSEICRGPAGLS